MQYYYKNYTMENTIEGTLQVHKNWPDYNSSVHPRPMQASMTAKIYAVTKMDMLEQFSMQSLPVSLQHGSLWDLVIT